MTLTKIDDRGLKTPIELLDNEKIKLGTSNDLQIYHDGNNSVITAGGAGDLQLTSTFDDVIIQAADNVFIKGHGVNNGLQVYGDGAVKLYYDGSTNPKLETLSTGVRTNGNVQLPFVDANNGLRNKIQWVSEADYFDETAYIAVDRTATSGAVSDLVFATGSVNAVSQRLRIDSDGKIDLNASPGKFGNSHSTGTTYLFGNDIRFTNADITSTNAIIDSTGIKLPSGKGINFYNYGSGTSVGSNLLDDYEEGTWTPAFKYWTGSAWADVAFSNTPATTNAGLYTKIGNVVHFSYYSENFVVTTGAGSTASLDGLPFTHANGFFTAITCSHWNGMGDNENGYVSSNSTQIRFTEEDSIDQQSWGSGLSHFMISGTYRVA